MFLFIALISCNTNNDYEFEDKLYDCIINSNKNVNIEKKVKQLEKIFIKYEILSNSRGKSYVEFINRIFKLKSFSSLISDKLKEELKPFENIPDKITCLDTTILFDTIAARNSRLHVMTYAFEKALSESDISEPIGLIAFKYLTEDDFNHKFYKITFLLFLTKYILNPDIFYDSGMKRKLPPISKEDSEPVEIKERNIMIVFVGSENKIFVNNTEIKIKELNKMVKIFLLNPDNDKNLPEKKEIDLPKVGKIKVSKGIISFQTDRNTSYELYFQVQNELVRAINELRDDFSIKIFNKNFDNLTDEDKDIVSKVYPLCISEVEPRRMRK